MLQYSASKIKKLKKFNLSYFPGYSTKFNIKSNILNDLRYNRNISSYFLIDLIEKQKLKFLYKLNENIIKTYLFLSIGRNNINLNYIINLRIDSFLYNIGFCITVFQARQLITHGHIFINLNKITCPSYLLKRGDVLSINPFSSSIVSLCKYNLFIRYNTSFISFINLNILLCSKQLKCKILNTLYLKVEYIKYKDSLIYNYFK